MPDLIQHEGDVEKAKATLLKYHATAKERGNKTAVEEVENIMRLLNRIYPIYYRAVMEECNDNKSAPS